MKEWKGNSRAATRMLGIKTDHTTKGREQDDFYATDPEALQKLLDGCSTWLKEYLNREKPKQLNDHIPHTIWECACGCGNLANVLILNGFRVYATDLKDRGYGIRGIDFLKEHESISPIILTNPPFSLANDFAEHALKILPVGGGVRCTYEYNVYRRKKAV